MELGARERIRTSIWLAPLVRSQMPDPLDYAGKLKTSNVFLQNLFGEWSPLVIHTPHMVPTAIPAFVDLVFPAADLTQVIGCPGCRQRRHITDLAQTPPVTIDNLN
jgi:hypothetical protein